MPNKRQTIKTTIIISPTIDFKQRHANKVKTHPSLIQYNGTDLGKRYILDQISVGLGRSLSTDISINDGSVSRSHALIIKDGRNIIIEDADSANGTFANGVKVDKHLLVDQDIIRVGKVLLKFFAGDNIDSMIQDKIYQMATVDADTKTFNKQYLMSTLESDFRASKETGHPLSIIYYDLDFFKQVNDNYGHIIGDQILKENALLATSNLRKDDVLGRFGGEEFIIILPNTNIEAAYAIAEKLREICNGYTSNIEYESNGKTVKAKHVQKISAGVSEISPEMVSAIDLLKSADKKLYISKNEGRDKVTH